MMPSEGTVHLANELMSVDIDTLRGGALTSIHGLGREWLVSAPSRQNPVTATSSFTADPPGGWDEMAPTIVACTVDGQSLPDHGDAWRAPWTPRADGALVHRSPLGYELSRLAQLSGSRLQLDYSLTTDRPRPVLWAAHPLVVAPDGTRTILEDYEGAVIDVVTVGTPTVDWHPLLTDPAALRPGTYRKYVLPPDVRVGAVRIVHPDGAWLRLSWDPERLPYLAIYAERHAFSRQPCVAVEPMTGWFDSLSTAVQSAHVLHVSPERPATWTLSVDIGGG